MKLRARTDDWKLNPRVVLPRLTNPASTPTAINDSLEEEEENTGVPMIEVKKERSDESLFTFNTFFTRDDVTIDLKKIASDCDPQCESCWTLIRQLSAHVAENHSQNNCEEIRKTRKRKRNEKEDLYLPPPGEESDPLFYDDEMERDDVSSFKVDGDFSPNNSNDADLKVEAVEDQGQGQEMTKRQTKRNNKLELLTTATTKRASSSENAARNSDKIKKKKTSKKKRKNIKVSSNIKQNSPAPTPAANNQDDYVTKTGRVTRKPIKYEDSDSDSDIEDDQDNDSDFVSTNIERESDPLTISPDTSASVTLESSEIVQTKKKKKIPKIDPDFPPDGDEPDSNSDDEISEDENFEILKSELTGSTTRKMYINKPGYTCRKCKEEFIEKDEFNDHFKTHAENSTIVELDQPEGNIMCGICNAIFPIISELTQHVRMTHELTRLHECHICDLKFDLKELSQHFELFHPDQLPFACKICTDEPKLTFSGPQELQLHKRIVHTKKKVYPCNQCSKVFLGRFARKQHSEVHEKERKEHICDKCGKSYDTLGELDAHNMTHIPKKNFICSVEDCEKRFTAQEVLDAHVRLVHGQGHEKSQSQPADTNSVSTSTSERKDTELEIQKMAPFACRFCTHTYAAPGNLVKHLRKDHGNLLVNKFNCYLCKSKFLDRVKLLQHMRSEHPYDKPFGCETCNMGFGRSSLLTMHIQAKHTVEKPFACPICKKGFVIKQNMEAHVANQHTGEKLHKCDKCEKSYACLTHLKTHKLTHEGIKPFMCDQCGKCFGCRTGLAGHLIVHKTTATGEKLKPYACKEKDCNARFTLKSGLNTHSVIHSGVRSHLCQECGWCFRRAHHLRRHLKTQHNKEKDTTLEETTDD